MDGKKSVGEGEEGREKDGDTERKRNIRENKSWQSHFSSKPVSFDP